MTQKQFQNLLAARAAAGVTDFQNDPEVLTGINQMLAYTATTEKTKLHGEKQALLDKLKSLEATPANPNAPTNQADLLKEVAALKELVTNIKPATFDVDNLGEAIGKTVNDLLATRLTPVEGFINEQRVSRLSDMKVKLLSDNKLVPEALSLITGDSEADILASVEKLKAIPSLIKVEAPPADPTPAEPNNPTPPTPPPPPAGGNPANPGETILDKVTNMSPQDYANNRAAILAALQAEVGGG